VSGRHLFDVSSSVLGGILDCVWTADGGGRQFFDVSSTVLAAILNCEWFGEGGGDTCFMLAALCWVRY
jgi:hypothetical protein